MIRAYESLVSLHKAEIESLISGEGYVWGGGLTSHDIYEGTSNLLDHDYTWKINGWFTYKSPIDRKENDLNQTSMIMF